MPPKPSDVPGPSQRRSRPRAIRRLVIWYRRNAAVTSLVDTATSAGSAAGSMAGSALSTAGDGQPAQVRLSGGQVLRGRVQAAVEQEVLRATWSAGQHDEQPAGGLAVEGEEQERQFSGFRAEDRFAHHVHQVTDVGARGAARDPGGHSVAVEFLGLRVVPRP